MKNGMGMGLLFRLKMLTYPFVLHMQKCRGGEGLSGDGPRNLLINYTSRTHWVFSRSNLLW